MPAKILLVEDDNNLREIYQARLMAEGYTIVTARDGEEALGIAKAELPALIISDVMMPRVSGFEMLDILRNTDGLKDAKVIMLTALGQADDKTRANSLGADRYLVKSQVTLEDIVKTAHELLEGAASDAAATPPVGSATPAASATAIPTAPTAAPAPTPTTVQDDAVLASAMHDLATDSQPSPEPASMPAAPAPAPIAAAAGSMPVVPEPPAVSAPTLTPATPPAAPATPPVSPVDSGHTAAPLPGIPAAPTLATPPVPAPAAPMPQPPAPTSPAPAAPSTSEEQAAIGAQIDQFVNGAPGSMTGPATPPAPAAPMPQPPAPAQPAIEPTDEAVQPGDNVVIANKKVIQPLQNADARPPIHELLAREQAAEQQSPAAAAPTPATVTPTASGPAESQAPPIPPTPATPPAPAAGPDPNSIAL